MKAGILLYIDLEELLPNFPEGEERE